MRTVDCGCTVDSDGSVILWCKSRSCTQRDRESQRELSSWHWEQGIDPDSMRCRSCGAIYDGGIRCTYCGDQNPVGDSE